MLTNNIEMGWNQWTKQTKQNLIGCMRISDVSSMSYLSKHMSTDEDLFLRPSQTVQSSLHVIRARHQNILKLWGLVDNMERMCAGPTFYDTPPGTVPEIRLPDWLLSVSGLGSLSLEFPSVACSSAFYSSWFVPTDWSARAEGGNIMFCSNHCDSFWAANTTPPLPVHPLFTSQPFLQIEVESARVLF